jgi:hypothetical protein
MSIHASQFVVARWHLAGSDQKFEPKLRGRDCIVAFQTYAVFSMLEIIPASERSRIPGSDAAARP